MITDPIADLLTRIRNATMRGSVSVKVPHSIAKESIVKILKEEHFVEDYMVNNNGHKDIVITLLYRNGEPAITHIEKISKPGVRRYSGYRALRPVLQGYGIGIISTPQGIISDKKARELKVGGELICQVW